MKLEDSINKSEPCVLVEGPTWADADFYGKWLQAAAKADALWKRCKLMPFISQADRDWDEIVGEGYDPDHSPMGCPVYWRVVKRTGEELYCSTFSVTRYKIFQGCGECGLAYCDPIAGTAVVRLETIGSLLTREGL